MERRRRAAARQAVDRGRARRRRRMVSIELRARHGEQVVAVASVEPVGVGEVLRYRRAILCRGGE